MTHWHWVWAGCLISSLGVAALGGKEPHIPRSDTEVVEVLYPRLINPELKQLEEKHLASPNDLAAALTYAEALLDAGNDAAEPRFNGFAVKVLSPWWKQARPPVQTLFLRARVRYNEHLYSLALEDLDKLLAQNKSYPKAQWLRAEVLRFQGDWENSLKDCKALSVPATRLEGAACHARVLGLTGRLEEAYASLMGINLAVGTSKESLALVQETLADLTYRMGKPKAAEAHYRAALRIHPRRVELLAQYADLLHDEGRSAEVIPLLRSFRHSDELLLRLALAKRTAGDPEWIAETAELGERFNAGRARGTSFHDREEAMYSLLLKDDANAALNFAKKNWNCRKEPLDLRILLEASLAAKDRRMAKEAIGYLEKTKLQYPRLEVLKEISEKGLLK